MGLSPQREREGAVWVNTMSALSCLQQQLLASAASSACDGRELTAGQSMMRVTALIVGTACRVHLEHVVGRHRALHRCLGLHSALQVCWAVRLMY